MVGVVVLALVLAWSLVGTDLAVYYGDPAPSQPLDLDRPEHTRLLTPEEYAEWGARIREALAAEGAL